MDLESFLLEKCPTGCFLCLLNYNPTIFHIVHIHITLYFYYLWYVYISFFFNSHTSKRIFFLFFVIYVTASSISNTMLKLHNTWIKFKKFTYSNCDAHSSPLFSQLGLIKLLDLLTNHTTLFKFQFHHNLLATAFDNFFSLISSKHGIGYSTM